MRVTNAGLIYTGRDSSTSLLGRFLSPDIIVPEPGRAIHESSTNARITERGIRAFAVSFVNGPTDAADARVRKETRSEVTRTIGPHYEVTVAVSSGQVLTTTRYYDFGGLRIAVRQNGTLSYLHSDHLESTTVTTDN